MTLEISIHPEIWVSPSVHPNGVCPWLDGTARLRPVANLLIQAGGAEGFSDYPRSYFFQSCACHWMYGLRIDRTCEASNRIEY